MYKLFEFFSGNRDKEGIYISSDSTFHHQKLKWAKSQCLMTFTAEPSKTIFLKSKRS